jgi:hypothetical protein
MNSDFISGVEQVAQSHWLGMRHDDYFPYLMPEVKKAATER